MNQRTSHGRLSVVIAGRNAEQVIEACLTTLVQQIDVNVDEIIVADSSDDLTPEIVKTVCPEAQLLHFNQPLTLPQLRGRAIAASQGDIIAILDPYSIVKPGWVNEILKAHHEHTNPVIGGAVDLYRENQQSLLAWTQYINEYGMFMSPVPEGEVEILPGSNISYKRSVLFDGDRPRYPEFWKTFINWDTESGGSALWLAPKVQVQLWKAISFLDFLRTRRDHGRCFAAMRSDRASKSERLLRAATTPLLPFVFLLRWGRRYWARRRRRREFVLTLPLQFLLFGNWALGEFEGYCFGSGFSCQKLFY